MHLGTDFHYHVLGIQPEVAKVHMYFFQGFILVYFVAVSILFICQAKRRRKINDSVK